jgi:hypothetical protein
MPVAVEPVWIWTGGDDGLTQRVREAVAAELFLDRRFAPAVGGGDPAPFRLGIPTHVDWRETPAGTRVTVTYNFTVRGLESGPFTVSCFETRLSVRARRIARDAVRAFRP